MGRYTDFTRAWLDHRYRRFDEEGHYHAHQPIYGRGQATHCEADHLFRLARHTQILDRLARLDGQTLLDVGASEGFGAHLAREELGLEVTLCDLSSEAMKRAADLFGHAGIAADSAHLPFPDRHFDIVLCSEVLEHVEHPVATLLELARVARRAVIVTSDEITSDRARAAAHRPPMVPHIERNLFHTEDFATIWGGRVEVVSQQKGAPPADDVPDEVALRWVLKSLEDDRLHPDVGAMATLLLDDEVSCAPRKTREELARAALRAGTQLAPLARRPAPLSPKTLAALRCPRTGSPLSLQGTALVSEGDAGRYAFDEEVPLLLHSSDPPQARIEARLRARHGQVQAKVEAALAIQERLSAPVPENREAWDFRDVAHRDEWLAGPALTLHPDDTALDCQTTAPGAFLIGPPVRYPRAGIAVLDLEVEVLEAPTTGATGRVYWLGPDHPGFEVSRSRSFDLPAPGSRRLVTVTIGGLPHSSGPPLDFMFRLDPIESAGRVRVHALRIIENGAIRDRSATTA